MAVGDFTITSNTLISVGNARQVSGTIEAGNAAAQADIFPKGNIVSFSIDSNLDGLATAIPTININTSDGSTSDPGSVWIDTNVGGPETFVWTAVFR